MNNMEGRGKGETDKGEKEDGKKVMDKGIREDLRRQEGARYGGGEQSELRGE